MAPSVAGTLLLPPVGPVDVRVTLEDITRQDSVAVPLAETRLTQVEGDVPFTLDIPLDRADPRRDYNIAARAYRPGHTTPLAGTVAVHPWPSADAQDQAVRLQPFASDREEQP